MKINKEEILSVENLTVRYASNQNPILKDFKLEINKGDHLAIIGSSGCGKSTFAKSIVNMLPEGSITEGKILLSGKDPREIIQNEVPLFRRNIFGFIYQDSIKRLNPLMTVGDHLFELLKTHYKNKSNFLIKRDVKEIFQKVGIDYLRINAFPNEFSGGMRQRICIAMALALRPKLLIADEPTTSLDAHTSFEIMNELLSLCKEFGSTLLLISHDINLASKWCKKIAIIDKGMIVEKGSIDKILKNPKSIIGNKLVKAAFMQFEIKSKPEKKNIALEVNNLRHWYKLNNSFFQPKWNKALNEVSFKVFRNETLGIIGMSGSGKSTLCRSLVGLLNPRGGEIKIYKSKTYRNNIKTINTSKTIQIIFQDPFSSLNPKMTIKNILKDILLFQKITEKKQIKYQIKLMMKNLNLPTDNKFLESYPSQLSGGQLQRVSIARALLIKPEILICDESVNMLDAAVKIEILKLIRKMQEKMNLTIIFITHDLAIAKNFCNRLLVMNNGKIIERGDSFKIISNPENICTKTLVRSSLNLN